eukprot:gene2282-2593_t
MTPNSTDGRCAALASMTRAVEDMHRRDPDNGQLHSQLWSDDCLTGLFFCLSHDPSIKVRRAAVQLMQLVTLPRSSGAVEQLVRALGLKVCDKDAVVSITAFEMLVQLDASVLCSCLTASQWCRVVLAGMELCCNSHSQGSNQRPRGQQAGLNAKQELPQNTAAAAAVAANPQQAYCLMAGSQGQTMQGAGDGLAVGEIAGMEIDDATGCTVPRDTTSAGHRPSASALVSHSAQKKKRQQPPRQCVSDGARQQFLQLLRSVLLAAALCDDQKVAACLDGAGPKQSPHPDPGWMAQQRLHPVTGRQWLHNHAGAILGMPGCCLLLMLLLQDPQLEPLWEELEQYC